MHVSATKENTPPKKRDTICSPKAMELCKANSAGVQENVPPSVNQKVRDTIYSPSRMEQSSEKTEKAVQIDMASPRRTLGLSTTGNVIDGSEPRRTKTPELNTKDIEPFRIHRRRTLYTPGVYDESDKQQISAAKTPVINKRRTLFNPDANSTAATYNSPAIANVSDRRKTLYTPSAFEDIPATPETTTPVANHGSKRLSTPHSMHIPKHLAASVPSKSTTQKRNTKTLLEEYQSNLTFSSTKTPMSERRKTIFDISMDIIDKRLSQINKQSKQSDPRSEETQPQPVEAALKSPPPRPSSVVRQTSLDSFYRKQSRSTEKTIKFNTYADIRESPDVTNATTTSRKRKLFNAIPSLTETPPPSSAIEVSGLISISENPTKKSKTTTPAIVKAKVTTPVTRRSLAPAAPKSALKTAAVSTRRSSMFFSQPNKPITSAVSSKPVMGTQARTMKALGLGAGLPTVASQSTSGKSQFQLSTTNLHATQHTYVKEVRLH